VPFEKVIFQNDIQACGVCGDRKLLTPSSKDNMPAIIYEDEKYIVTLADGAKRTESNFPAPGFSKIYIFWVKGTHSWNRSDVGFEYFLLCNLLQKGLPFIPKRFSVTFHLDTNTWDHPHFRVSSADTNDYPSVGVPADKLTFDEVSNDYLFKLIRLIYYIYLSNKNHQPVVLPKVLNTLYPMREVSKYSRPGILTIKAAAVFASAMEWFNYIHYDLTIPEWFYAAIEATMESKVYSDPLEAVWRTWLQLRYIIEIDHNFLKLVRQCVFPRIRYDREIANKILLAPHVAKDILGPVGLIRVPIQIVNGTKRVPKGVINVDRKYGLESEFANIIPEGMEGRSDESDIYKEFYAEYVSPTLLPDFYDMKKILANIGALKTKIEPMLIVPKVSQSTQTD